MSIFNEEQIRQAIDGFQKAHPVAFAFDIHHIRDDESLDIIKRTIDDLCEKAERDSEMHISMEMAKQYMNGVRPSYDAYSLKPVKMIMDERHTQRIINGVLDERTQTIYANSITMEEAIAIGWKIEKMEANDDNGS